LQGGPELTPIHSEAHQQLPNLSKPDIPFGAFYRTHESAIEARLVREPLLRVARRSPVRAHDLGEGQKLFMSFHGWTIVASSHHRPRIKSPGFCVPFQR
jgi:hypothetical protein